MTVSENRANTMLPEPMRQAGYWLHMPRMDLHLRDEQAAALERELRNIVDGDRYQFSARIRTFV